MWILHSDPGGVNYDYYYCEFPFLDCWFAGADVNRLRRIEVDVAWVAETQKFRRAGLPSPSWKAFTQEKEQEFRHTPYFTILFVLVILLVFLIDIWLNNWIKCL